MDWFEQIKHYAALLNVVYVIFVLCKFYVSFLYILTDLLLLSYLNLGINLKWVLYFSLYFGAFNN